MAKKKNNKSKKKNNKNIKNKIPKQNNPIISKDKTVVLTHGNRDNLQNAKQHFVDLLGIIPDYIHFGHIHHFNIKDDCDTEITTNGSLISTDDFATSIRKNTKASQALIIYGEDVCTYKIVLN